MRDVEDSRAALERMDSERASLDGGECVSKTLADGDGRAHQVPFALLSLILSCLICAVVRCNLTNCFMICTVRFLTNGARADTFVDEMRQQDGACWAAHLYG